MRIADLSKPKRTDSETCCNKGIKSSIDQDRRQFLSTGVRILGCLGAVCALVPFVASLKPTRKVLESNGPLEVDLSGLAPGQQITVQWRGKPIWILRRTQAMLAQLNQPNMNLRDPFSKVDQQPAYAKNAWRSVRPEYLVLVGVCTHLGCTPQYKSQDKMFEADAGGYYCPCHGSRYDLAGRVYQHAPAPINLEVPPYQFINEHTIVIGDRL